MSLYQDYFHFSRAPFGITPDPGILMLGEEHRKAIGALTYGIRDRKGFIVITGEVGIGKTTVLRACLLELEPEQYKIIYIFDPHLDVPRLYAAILGGLIGDTTGEDVTLGRIHHALLDCFQAGVNVILAIDEAQHVPLETLESLRLISNFEADDCKLMQIILVGQTELDTLLSRHELRQLDQRVAVRVRMAALSIPASIRYIAFRLEASGHPGRDLFSLPALYYIALRARGIPRSLNIFCDNALVNCLGHNAKRVTLSLARSGIRDFLQRPTPRPTSSRRPATVLAVLAGIGIGISLTWLVVTESPLKLKLAFAPTPAPVELVRITPPVPVARPPAITPTQTPAPAPASTAVPAPAPMPTSESAALPSAVSESQPIPVPLPMPAPPPPPPQVRSSVPVAPVTAPAVRVVPPPVVPPSPAIASTVEPRPQPAPPAPVVMKVVAAPPPVPVAAPAPAPAPALVPTPTSGPVSAPAGAQAAVPSPVISHTVVWGDTLWGLCRQIYGQCPFSTFNYVLTFNRGIQPNLIIRGHTLRFPDRNSLPAVADQRGQTLPQQP